VAPRRFSRLTFATAVTDEEGDLWLVNEEPYRYRAFSDNREHVVAEGDELWTLADKYFQGVPRPAGLWWVIADFQPDPIHDPTIKLEVGRVLAIPSLRTVVEEIFSEKRRSAGT
jgi:hypothetical protein